MTTIIKQTKAEFLRQATSKGVRFHGALWNQPPEHVFEKLNEILHPEKAELCRVEKYSDGIRRERTKDGEKIWSHTDLRKETKVYQSGDFWILFSTYPSLSYSNNKIQSAEQTCAVAYSIK